MPAPKGNTYGKKNKGNYKTENRQQGRPPEEFSDQELINIGSAMVKWVKENDPLHLKAWCNHAGYLYDSQVQKWRTRKVFLHYYEDAMSHISSRFMERAFLKEGDSSIANRFMGVYFKDVYEHDISLKKAGNEALERVIITSRNKKSAKDSSSDTGKPKKS